MFSIVIKGKDVKHIAVPYYEGLSINDLWGFLNQNPTGYSYLPEKVEIHKVPKQFLCNVIHSVEGEKFA